MRGITPYVTQDLLKSEKSHIDTRGASKAEVMEGEPKCPNLIEASVYNTKYFHCISMATEDSNWVVKDKEFFNVHMVKVKN